MPCVCDGLLGSIRSFEPRNLRCCVPGSLAFDPHVNTVLRANEEVDLLSRGFVREACAQDLVATSLDNRLDSFLKGPTLG